MQQRKQNFLYTRVKRTKWDGAVALDNLPLACQGGVAVSLPSKSPVARISQ
jgi:hypothetical protein